MDSRGQEGCTADNLVADSREGEGRPGRAAKQRRGATGSVREGKRAGASELVRRAARCRAGVQG